MQWWQTQHRPFPTTRTPDLASPGIRRCSRRSRVGRPLRIPDRSGPTACPSPGAGPAHHAGLERGATPLGGLSRSSASVNLGCRTAPSLSAQRPGRFPCRTDAGHRPGGMRRSARADAPRVARPVCSSAIPGHRSYPGPCGPCPPQAERHPGVSGAGGDAGPVVLGHRTLRDGGRTPDVAARTPRPGLWGLQVSAQPS